MRARGAQVTDIVVLVVAADDSVMPQTIEAISHAKNAGVPLIVAINKIDLPQANPSKVKQELLQHGVVLEEFGGNTLSTEISAKKGTNVDELLDQMLLQAEILDLKANPKRRAKGTVVEAQLDPGKGPVATVLVQNGTLNVGDDFIAGMYSGRVRALLDERGKPVKQAGPAIPVQILGFRACRWPAISCSSSRTRPRRAKSRSVASASTAKRRAVAARAAASRSKTSWRSRRRAARARSTSSSRPTRAARRRRSPTRSPVCPRGEVKVDVIHRGVGAITESDILLAKTAGAIIIGFHVRPDNNARTAAEREGVEIRLYRIIYEAVADVRAAMEGMLRPEEREVVLGEAEVREVFKISRIGTIAGCSVRSGVINRQGRVRVVRDGVEVFDGTLASLKRFKDDVREVREGFECGIGVENFNDIKVGDVIECYRKEAVARTLEVAAVGLTERSRCRPTIAAPIAWRKRSARRSRPSSPKRPRIRASRGSSPSRCRGHARPAPRQGVRQRDGHRRRARRNVRGARERRRRICGRASAARCGCVSRPRSRSSPMRASSARRASRRCSRRSRTAQPPASDGDADD